MALMKLIIHNPSDGNNCFANSKIIHFTFNFCEAQGKGRAKGPLRKVTQRSFIDGGWWISFP